MDWPSGERRKRKEEWPGGNLSSQGEEGQWCQVRGHRVWTLRTGRGDLCQQRVPMAAAARWGASLHAEQPGWGR